MKPKTKENLTLEVKLLKKELLEQTAQNLRLGYRFDKDNKSHKNNLVTCVFIACKVGDILSLSLFLRELASETKSILKLRQDTFCPLEVAVQNHQLEICRYLVLQHHAKVNWETAKIAVLSLNQQITAFLMENSKLNHVDLTKLLYSTISVATIKMIKMFLALGANPYDPLKANSCLGISIISKNLEAFKLFLTLKEVKQNINVWREEAFSFGYWVAPKMVTPFLLAALENNWQFAKILLDDPDLYVDINAHPSELLAPIHCFAHHDNLEFKNEREIYLVQSLASDYPPCRNAYVITTDNGAIVHFFRIEEHYSIRLPSEEWHDLAQKINFTTIQESKPLKGQISDEILEQLKKLLNSCGVDCNSLPDFSDNSEAILTLLEHKANVDIPGCNHKYYPEAREKILFIKNKKEMLGLLLDVGMFGKNNQFKPGAELIVEYAVSRNSLTS